MLSEINEKIKAEIQEQHVQLQLKYAIEIVKILRLSSFLSFFFIAQMIWEIAALLAYLLFLVCLAYNFMHVKLLHVSTFPSKIMTFLDVVHIIYECVYS